MKKIKTEIEINAPVDKVWEVISNFNEWKEWNPIISNVTGEAKLGTKLNVMMIKRVNLHKNTNQLLLS